MPKNDEEVEVSFISKTDWWEEGGTILFQISFWRNIKNHQIHVEVRNKDNKRVRDDQINSAMISFIEKTVIQITNEDEIKN